MKKILNLKGVKVFNKNERKGIIGGNIRGSGFCYLNSDCGIFEWCYRYRCYPSPY